MLNFSRIFQGALTAVDEFMRGRDLHLGGSHLYRGPQTHVGGQGRCIVAIIWKAGFLFLALPRGLDRASVSSRKPSGTKTKH